MPRAKCGEAERVNELDLEAFDNASGHPNTIPYD